MRRGLTLGGVGLTRKLSEDWTKHLGAEYKGELRTETGPNSKRRSQMMTGAGGNWSEGPVRTRIGLSIPGRCLRGRCRVGSQRSVNSGDVTQARWQKGEPVIQLSGVGA